MRSKYAFLLILLFFLITRLFSLTKIPPSLYWDEASIGYSAYSLSLSGHDEWGEFLPLHFRAFGEFKLPIYIFTVAIFTKIIGVGTLAVRLPAVLYSMGTLILVYLLGKKLVKNGEFVGLLSMFLLSITPWFLLFSRVGYEASAGLFFFLLSIYFLVYDKLKEVSYLLAIVFLIASIYSYNSFRILSLFILPIYIYTGYKNISKSFWFLGSFTFLVSLVPMFRLYLLDFGGVRYQTIALMGTTGQKLIQFFMNYLSHFSYNFLFAIGDINLRSHSPGMGELLFIDLPFLILGTLFVLKRKINYSFYFLYLLVISPIPSAITREAPHALRGILLLPILVFLTAFGIYYLYLGINKGLYRYIYVVVISFIIFLSFAKYYLNFLNNYTFLSSQDWQWGYKKLIYDYSSEFNSFNKVVISDRYSQPYIFILYYLKIPPETYRKSVSFNTPDQWGFSTVRSFDKFEFKKVDSGDYKKGSIIFATEEDRLEDIIEDKKLYFLDGSTAFWVYKP